MRKSMLCLAAFFLLIGLSACGHTAGKEIGPNSEPFEIFSEHTELPPEEQEDKEEILQLPLPEGFYPVTGFEYAWIEKGTILAVRNHADVQYIDLKSRLIKTTTIPADYYTERLAAYNNTDVRSPSFSFCDNRILVQDYHSAEGMVSNFSACYADGEWFFVNGSLWDSDGNLIRDFLQYEYHPAANKEESERHFLSGGKEVKRSTIFERHQNPIWINDDLFVITNCDQLFLYRVSTDTLSLIRDVDEPPTWEITPAENGFYYTAYKDFDGMVLPRTAFWYVDETGFAEQIEMPVENWIFTYKEELLIGTDHIGHRAGIKTAESARLWYATDRDPVFRDLAEWAGYFLPKNTPPGVLAFVGYDEPYRIQLISTSDASISTYTPTHAGYEPHAVQAVRKSGDSLQYFYSLHAGYGDDGYMYAKLYVYDMDTNTHRDMDINVSGYGEAYFNEAMTHVVEHFQHRGARVREIG